MKLIAHRGNTEGAKPNLENQPEYIYHAISNGFDVEVDVWCDDGMMWLGHDSIQYHLTHNEFMYLLQTKSIWWHAKDYKTLDYMLSHGRSIKVFAHEGDKYGLVNGGYIWTADLDISLKENNRTIWILPTLPPNFVLNDLVYGLCTDDFTTII